jgi:hypothetical protein
LLDSSTSRLLVTWRRVHSGELKAIHDTSMVRVQFPSQFEFLKQRQLDEKLLSGPNVKPKERRSMNSCRKISFAFTDREMKLLRLVLDPAASTGEIQNGALKLAQSLRARRVKADAIEAATFEDKTFAMTRPDYGKCQMPFGQFKGKPLAEIRPDYLQFLLRWIRDNPDPPYWHHRLANNIEKFLLQ